MGGKYPRGGLRRGEWATDLLVRLEGEEVVRVLRVSQHEEDNLEDVSYTRQRHDLLAVQELLTEVHALISTVHEAVDEQPVDGARRREAGGVHLRAVLAILHFQRVAHGVEHLHDPRGQEGKRGVPRMRRRCLLAGGVGLALVDHHHLYE